MGSFINDLHAWFIRTQDQEAGGGGKQAGRGGARGLRPAGHPMPEPSVPM